MNPPITKSPGSSLRVYTHSPYSFEPSDDVAHRPSPTVERRPAGHGRTWSSASHKSQVSIVSFEEEAGTGGGSFNQPPVVPVGTQLQYHHSREHSPADPCSYSNDLPNYGNGIHQPPNTSYHHGGTPTPPIPPALSMITQQHPQQSQSPKHQKTPSSGRGHNRRHSRGHSRQFSTDSTNSASKSKKFAGGTAPAVPSIFHTQLTGFLDFVYFPTHDVLQHTVGDGLPGIETEHGLFFGQVKFEATAELMTWIIRHLTEGEVMPLHAHPRGSGCFMAYFATEEHCARLQQLNEMVLFDECGMWIAHNEKEREVLHKYVDDISSSLRGVRLPRGCMVIRK